LRFQQKQKKRSGPQTYLSTPHKFEEHLVLTQCKTLSYGLP